MRIFLSPHNLPIDVACLFSGSCFFSGSPPLVNSARNAVNLPNRISSSIWQWGNTRGSLWFRHCSVDCGELTSRHSEMICVFWLSVLLTLLEQKRKQSQAAISRLSAFRPPKLTRFPARRTETQARADGGAKVADLSSPRISWDFKEINDFRWQ